MGEVEEKEMDGSVRWGLLSTARINRRLAPGIRASRLTELAGVASRDRSKAERAVRELGAERAFGSYEEMLASDAIDAIYLSLPNSLHAEWAMKAAEAGKHVLCEKPLASTSEEAKQVVDVCEREGVLLMEAFMYRHHPQHAQVREIISSGRIGDPLVVHAQFTYYLAPSEDIRWTGELSGGALMDVGCYCINASRLIFEAEPITAKGLGRYDGVRGVDVTTLALLEFPDNRFASFSCSMLLQRSNRYEVVGSEGSIEVPTAFVPGNTDVVLRVSDRSGSTEVVVPGVDQYRLEVEHFSKCILDGTSLTYPAENGLATMRTIDAVRSSSLTS